MTFKKKIPLNKYFPAFCKKEAKSLIFHFVFFKFFLFSEASARQVDDAIAIEDATEVISENDEESTTTIQPTTTTTTEPATLENGCPVGSRSRGGRLIMAPRRLTRTFTSISLGSVLVLSTGTSKTF